MASVRLATAALMICLVSAPAPAQPDEEVVTCSNRAPVADYGPTEQFDGIFFSFIDVTSFAPCDATRACEQRPAPDAVDLQASDAVWMQMNEAGARGWGYYRLAFEGRRGHWRDSRFCFGGTQDFIEVLRVLRVARIG